MANVAGAWRAALPFVELAIACDESGDLIEKRP
jgi:hypothetical protein